MPVPTLKSISLARLVHFFRFNSTEREHIRNKIEPVPSLATIEHEKLVKERLGTSTLNYGLLVEEHEVLRDSDNFDDREELRAYVPAVQLYKARTTYLIVSSHDHKPDYQLSKSIQERATVEFELSRTGLEGGWQSLSFCLTLQYKGLKGTLEDHTSLVEYSTRSFFESWGMSFWEPCVPLIKDLRTALGVAKLSEMFPLEDVERRRAMLRSIAEEDSAMGEEPKVEMLLLVEIFLGKMKGCLIEKWLSEDNKLAGLSTISELFYDFEGHQNGSEVWRQLG